MKNWHDRGLAIAAAVLLAALGWSIVRGTIAANLARSDSDAALAWYGYESTALTAAAENALGADSGSADIATARELGAAALRSDPLNEGALRVLGLAADVAGDRAQADGLMTMAAARSRRDLGAGVWLFDRRFSEGKPAEALQHADGLLRLKPDMLPLLVPALTEMAGDAGGRAALVSVLSATPPPPWRTAMLATLAQSAPLATYAALYAGLQDGSQPVQPVELGPYLGRLIDQGQFDLSFLMWLRALPPEQSAQLPYLFNGDFSLPVTNVAFDWRIAKADGATTEVADSGEQERGPALHVIFSGGRVNYHHVDKLLLLPPGNYALSGLVKPDDIENARGMIWRIFCAEADKLTLATTAPVRGSSDWTAFATGFVVPATGCRAQWLRLEIAATVSIEQEISGTIWYDHLAIKRVTDISASAVPAAPASDGDATAGSSGPT